MRPSLRNRLGIILIFAALSSCKSTLPADGLYYTLDPELEMSLDAGEKFEQYIFKIREGATPAGGDKSSSGCGCN